MKRIIAPKPIRIQTSPARASSIVRLSTKTTSPSSSHQATARNAAQNSSDPEKPMEKNIKHGDAVRKRKTVAQQDEELRRKLEGLSGDGGAAGVEYEGGKADGLKGEVKRNMFRVI